jgi:hypothetical protein
MMIDARMTRALKAATKTKGFMRDLRDRRYLSPPFAH